MELLPCTLEGEIVRLEPLRRSHRNELALIARDPRLWEFQPRALTTPDDVDRYVDLALAEQGRGLALPFVVVRRRDRRIIGSTRFMDVASEHRRVEIGATWLEPDSQRTGANVEAKLLLLAHAFEVLGVQKVVLKTEALNSQSRRAILALGAVEEGTLRRHLLADSGRPRDMVYFSILESEWPAVRARNEARVARHRRGDPPRAAAGA